MYFNMSIIGLLFLYNKGFFTNERKGIYMIEESESLLKFEYVSEIVRMVNECKDLALLDLIFKILLKTSPQIK